MKISGRAILVIIVVILGFIGVLVLFPSGEVVGGTTTTTTILETTTTTLPTTTTILTTTTTTVSIETTTTTVPTTTTSTTAVPEITTTTTIPTILVSRVIDGDTIELQNGERVRLLGINTPERGQFYYTEATNRLKEFVDGKNISLEKDVTDKDQYGRLLRYIHIDSIFVNLEMVKQGYASVYFISPNTKYLNLFLEAEDVAKNAKLGIWQSSNLSDCIGISYFHWDAEGNDCYNLNDEYIVFKNSCPYSIEMTGWTVKDEATHIYTFPDFTLVSEVIVTLYTGFGTDTATALYWGSSGYPCNAIWNNDGDTLYLRASDSSLVLYYSY